MPSKMISRGAAAAFLFNLSIHIVKWALHWKGAWLESASVSMLKCTIEQNVKLINHEKFLCVMWIFSNFEKRCWKIGDCEANCRYVNDFFIHTKLKWGWQVERIQGSEYKLNKRNKPQRKTTQKKTEKTSPYPLFLCRAQ